MEKYQSGGVLFLYNPEGGDMLFITKLKIKDSLAVEDFDKNIMFMPCLCYGCWENYFNTHLLTILFSVLKPKRIIAVGRSAIDSLELKYKWVYPTNELLDQFGYRIK